MDNLPPNYQEDQGEELDLHEQAGLTFWGHDEDGSEEWIGTNQQWRRFQELENEENNLK